MVPETRAPRLLVADDQRDVLETLRILLRPEGWEVTAVTSPEKAVDAVAEGDFDVALVDLNYTRDTTSGKEGMDLLAKLRALDATLPVVVMTAWGSIDLAVQAINRGARDFVQKPWENERLLAILRTQKDLSRALRNGERLAEENRILRETDTPGLVADSPAMKPVLELLARVGPSDANVLVTGENGTGKGVVAQALHALSSRCDKPLVTVNVGGLSEGVFESELFGHVKGAFTDARADRVGRFELADQGTLFLDEIANVPLAQQARLLRVLETGEFERVGSSRTKKSDVRIVSATNSDLEVEVSAGRFRRDLLFRLNTVEIALPPLRERKSDVPLLAMFFLDRVSVRYRKRFDGFTEEAMKALLAHAWPGNVRELSHTVERAVLMARGKRIDLPDLGLRTSAAPTPSYAAPPSVEDMELEDVEKLLIRKALSRTNGNVRQAAEFLGLSRSALYRRLARYGIASSNEEE